MPKLKITYWLTTLTILTSCEKLIIEKDEVNTPLNNFELLWDKVDRNYSFLEYKNIDWDSIYSVYRPKINNDLTDRELFVILADMMNELKDGHVNLYSGFQQSGNNEWYADYPENFNYSLLLKNYLGSDFQRSGSFMTTVLDSVGYIFSSSFSEKLKESEIDRAIEQLGDIKGIIFDVRHNSGGYSSNAKLIASRFADRKRLVSYTLYKTGPGHNDFSSPQANFVAPEGKKQFTGKVVILTNRRTYSATNDFVLSMSAFPNVTIMGDTTGGGGGTPYDYELLNGWRFRFPRTQTIAPDGFNVEHGIPPYVQVNLSRRDENRGVDTMIEAGIRLIKESV